MAIDSNRFKLNVTKQPSCHLSDGQASDGDPSDHRNRILIATDCHPFTHFLIYSKMICMRNRTRRNSTGPNRKFQPAETIVCSSAVAFLFANKEFQANFPEKGCFTCSHSYEIRITNSYYEHYSLNIFHSQWEFHMIISAAEILRRSS